MGELTVRVARVHDEAIDVRSFELRAADGGAQGLIWLVAGHVMRIGE